MYIELEYGKLNYEKSGSGPPVILLHGWGANIGAMSPIQRGLEGDFTVYSLDLPGFGDSEEPPEQWGIADYCDVLRDFIDKLSIENPILIGHSFGGRMSIYYTATYGGVHKVILVDSAGIKPKRKFSYHVKVSTYKAAKKMLKLPGLKHREEELLQKLKGKFGSADYKGTSGIMQQTMVKVVNEDLQHLMPDMKCPVLLIFGEQDTATPVSDGKRMEELIPDAGLVVLNQAGHYAYLDQPQQFQAVIHSFLEKDKRSRT
ncbi:alpha/beta fold hydrolase [Alkalicoccus urumqiensis]|uniref:Alpha/beta hydrolase n=1 Tax=Alkalicoccus urumqiensis TaxID=1548213 RepID=A0A2P6MGC7_ALKUR|nr:alpha/beta hydrolase [Alkalicoccus urumqiensis]PRO65334.1 alpha/beta hydrolase [Alkalicoccus urumqiensis]